MINYDLARDRNLSPETIARIEHLHNLRTDYYNKVMIAPEHDLPQWHIILLDLERELQELWGFPEDEKYIKFWRFPRCTCPQMDNDDRYPHGHYLINGSCPMHGGRRRW